MSGEQCSQCAGRLFCFLAVGTCLSANEGLNTIAHHLACTLRSLHQRISSLLRIVVVRHQITGITCIAGITIIAWILLTGVLPPCVTTLLLHRCLRLSVHQLIDGGILMNDHPCSTYWCLLNALGKRLCQ